MSIDKILGIILLVIGIICVAFGLNSSNALVDQLSEAVTGRFIQRTMLYIIVGIVLIIGGASLYIGKRPKS